MITVIQRVTKAHIDIDSNTIAKIDNGLLILCGFEQEDNDLTLNSMLAKCLKYRIFEDDEGKMNLSLNQINGGLLIVPQFTLAASTKNGLRPGFSSAATPEKGGLLFDKLIKLAHKNHDNVATGIFGADMQVHLCNDGPVTFVMQF